jgi:hypothetical protein
VHVGRLHRDEERLRDLLVAQLLRGQLRDSALARRQRFEPGQEDLARPRAGRHELFIGTLDQRSRAATVGQLDAVAEQLAGLGPLVPARQRSAELDQGKSAECDTDPSGDAPTARVLELLDNQLPRLVVLSKKVERRRGARAPGPGRIRVLNVQRIQDAACAWKSESASSPLRRSSRILPRALRKKVKA